LGIQQNDKELATKIEYQLKEINPEYFSYFDVEDLHKKINRFPSCSDAFWKKGFFCNSSF